MDSRNTLGEEMYTGTNGLDRGDRGGNGIRGKGN